MQKSITAAAITISGVVFFIFSYIPAGAYSIYGTSSSAPSAPAQNAGGTTDGLGNLFAPFQSFINSINSVGTNAVQVSAPSTPQSVPQNNAVTVGTENLLQNLFQQFDNWLYGIAGFHISGFFLAILNIFSWLLGVVKGAIDWLLGLLH